MERERARKIRFKTGTSFCFRDAWALGYTPGHTVGVWLGRPDGGYGREITGAGTAVPVMLQVFAALAVQEERTGSDSSLPVPANVLRVSHDELPPALQRFTSGSSSGHRYDAPAIFFPVNGTTLRLSSRGEEMGQLVLKSRGGVPPFYWLINGQPLGEEQQGAITHYTPQGVGLTRITLIDSRGKRDKVSFWLE
jgi:penicillin-binding protein 1C